jgi:hypothetical protein
MGSTAEQGREPDEWGSLSIEQKCAIQKKMLASHVSRLLIPFCDLAVLKAHLTPG